MFTDITDRKRAKESRLLAEAIYEVFRRC